MKHVHDTWYVLEDGSKADPDDVAPDDAGALRHKNGLAVAMRGSVPRTSGVVPGTTETAGNEEGGVGRDMASDKGQSAANDREMKPAAGGKGYRTRGNQPS